MAQTRKRQAGRQIKKLRTQKSQTKSRRKKGALQLQIDQIIRATPDVESFVRALQRRGAMGARDLRMACGHARLPGDACWRAVRHQANASARGGATRPGMGKHGKKNLGKNLGKEQGLAKGNAEGRAVGKCVGNGTSENQAKRNAAAHRRVPLFCNHICGATAQYKKVARTSRNHLRNAKNGACLAYGLGLEETDFSKYAEMYKYLPKYQAYIEGKDKAKMKNLHPVEGTPVPWR